MELERIAHKADNSFVMEANKSREKFAKVECHFCKRSGRVPLEIFDSSKDRKWYEHGEVREEFYWKELRAGKFEKRSFVVDGKIVPYTGKGFVSGEGLIYCSRHCWSEYCAD